MVTFAQTHGRIDETTGLDWVDVAAPPLGQSMSVLACRLRHFVATPGDVEDSIQLTFALGDSLGLVHAFETIPIPISGSPVIFDAMGVFSPLIQYGISHPHRIMMKVDTPLQAGDKLYTYGYGTLASEA